MAYKFLKDGTPFTALSLTERFDTLVSDVNAVDVDAIQFRGLGPEQLPSLVGTIDETVPEVFTAENEAETVSTPTTSGGPPLIDGEEYTAKLGLRHASSAPAFHTLPNPGFSVQPRNTGQYSLDRSTDASNATALLVLANVEVRQFEGVDLISYAPEGPFFLWGISLNEYEWDATVILELEDANGNKGYLPRTERQVSPRVTIGAAGNQRVPGDSDAVFNDPPRPLAGVVFSPGEPRTLDGRIAMSPLRDYPGGSKSTPAPIVEQFDHRTHQDVSIRTVITKSDLTQVVNSSNVPVTLTGVKHIRLGFGSLNKRSYKVQRANITVLPLLAEVKAD